MPSYLITWKPTTENPEKGWPLEALQSLARRIKAKGGAVEPWRFQSHRSAKVGDRVFVLRQGRAGPAIIGYGRLDSDPVNKNGWVVEVRLEQLVDPTVELLATAAELKAITTAKRVWGTQASGVSIADNLAVLLVRLVVGRVPVPVNVPPAEKKGATRNPSWTRDELILALELYFRVSPLHTTEKHPAIQELSDLLNRLPIHPANTPSFRNPNGVYMKLCNFLRLDPSYEGRGLDAGSKADEEVWNEFAGDRTRLEQVAQAIRDNARDLPSVERSPESDLTLEVAEGRILARTHLTRERDPRLAEKKKRQVLTTTGRLACEVCGFDYAQTYAAHGTGFAECHHRTPLSHLKPGTKTRLSDLAIVCANCHRMLHCGRRWLSTDDLKRVMLSAGATTS